MIALAAVLTLLAQEPPRIEETEYAADYARVIRAYEAAEKLAKSDPSTALRDLEEQVLASLPKLVETPIVVKFSKGAAKGADKERHEFFPWRLAGECALAAGRPDRAVEFLKKSPGSTALLEKAKSALAEKEKKPAPPPPLQKPAFTPAPFLERQDYSGALEALRAERERLGKDYDPLVTQVRTAAATHLKSAAASLAAALPRLKEPGFRAEHLDPCLAACTKIPADLESEELRWIRALSEWMRTPSPAALDRLAIDAARLDNDYHVVCDLAQKARLEEIQALVDEVRRADRAARRPILDRLDATEQALGALLKAKAHKEFAEAAAAARSRLPVDSQVLDQARRGTGTLRELRVLAGQLDLLWTSPERAKLGEPDQRELALYLGVTRCTALFLDGRTTDEVARDPRVVEVFRGVTALPKDVSPKISAVLELVKSGR